MTITLDMADAALISLLAFLLALLGYIAGWHDYEARHKPRGLLDDTAFAAALDELERKAIAADEAEFARKRELMMEHGFRDAYLLTPPPLTVLDEAVQLAHHAWLAREIDGEDETWTS